MQQEAMPGYVVSMLGAVAATLVLWALFGWTTGMPEGITGPVKGLALGALAWVGFHAGPTLASSFFEEQDATVWAIGAGYWGSLALVYGLIVGILHP